MALDDATCEGVAKWAERVGPGEAVKQLGGLPGVVDASLIVAYLMAKHEEEPRPKGLKAVQEAELMDLGKKIAAPGNPPSWVLDEDTWDRAKEAIRKRWADYDEPYAVVASIYQNMGGGVR